LDEGANVILISGPTQLNLQHPKLELIRIKTADEMLEQVLENWKSVDIGIFSAAVADYRPKKVAYQKIKKSEEDLSIELVKNPDILALASSQKRNDQLLIGFALETENLFDNAKMKLEKKNLDLIVMNTLEDEGAGFSSDTNKISILDNHNNFTSFELKSKVEVAKDIIDYIINYRK
jgi:phosphopantothenoylcysteine decarboxylase/phosphopantothenate--cysteine ligase